MRRITHSPREHDAIALHRLYRGIQHGIRRGDMEPMGWQADVWIRRWARREFWFDILAMFVSAVWNTCCIASGFLLCHIGLSSPLGHDMATTEFWMGLVVLAGFGLWVWLWKDER